MEHDPRYTDLMQEIKERLYTIDDVMSGRTALLGQLAHEFCFLQLRLICECISYSCVIAHAYIKELQTPEFQTQWSADSLIKNLDGLYENFYPQPRAMTATDAGVHLSEIDASYLTKAKLKKLNGICGDRLHRGSPRKYAFTPPPERLATDRQIIIDSGNEIFQLVGSHMMSHRHEPRYILCRFCERDVPVEVFYAGPKGDGATPPTAWDVQGLTRVAAGILVFNKFVE